jgi:endonuclease-8
MPEGPSIIILREEASVFEGLTVQSVHGSARIDLAQLAGQRLIAVRSWGKHFLLVFDRITVRIHLLMFGTYRINERKEGAKPRLGLLFPQGQELNFYTCSVQFLEAPADEVYDWRVDVMSDAWDEKWVRRLLRDKPDALVCDAILDQSVFAGAGNIFKNEVLFRIRVHPLSHVGALPAPKLRELVAQVRQYGGEFLTWKRAGVLRAHWLAHRQRTCPRCDIPFTLAKLGLTKRRSFYCEQCQTLYNKGGKPA